MLAVYAAAVYAFLHVPMLVLAGFSFNASRYSVWTGFSLEWYRATFRDGELGQAAWNSLVIALASMLFSTAFGTGCAYGLWKRGSRWISGSMYLSLITPEIVTGISLLAFYQWLFRYANFHLGMHTVILAHGIERDDRGQEPVVAFAIRARAMVPWIAVADAEIDLVEVLVVNDRVPHGAAAARDLPFALVGPGRVAL